MHQDWNESANIPPQKESPNSHLDIHYTHATNLSNFFLLSLPEKKLGNELER